MKSDKALKRILRDLSISLSEDSELRDIVLRHDDELGAIRQDGTVTVNPNHAEILDADISDEQEFALLVNTESHELEHAVATEVEKMEEFAKEYKGERPRLAAFIWNVIEDVYIDKRRTDRDPGLRPVQALNQELIRERTDPIYEDEAPRKHANAILQIGKMGGTPVGFEDVEDDEFKDYCAEAKHLVKEARNTPIQSERTEISHRIMDLIADYAGNLETPEIELPDFVMVMPEEMMEEEEENDPLPEPAENEEENEQMMGMGSGGSGKVSGSGEEDPVCPECGHEDPEETIEKVDAMTAARCNPPVSPENTQVENIEFIRDEEKDGLCGFRLEFSGQVALSERMGRYKVDQIDQTTVEILEPKDNYDDTEEVTGYECPDCGQDWLPMFNG